MRRIAVIVAGAVVGAVVTAWFTVQMDAVLGGGAVGAFVSWLGDGVLQDFTAASRDPQHR